MTRRLLIADDDVLFLRAMMFRCRELGAEVRGVSDGASALAEIRTDPPGMVILDVNMPGEDGVAIREAMLADPVLRKIPTVFLSGRSDPGVLDHCQILRSQHVLKGPSAWHQLRPLVCQHLEIEEAGSGVTAPAARDVETAPERPKILIVDDDRDLVLALKLRLGRAGYQPLVAFSGQDAYHTALRETPEIIITDYEMPGGSADYLLVRLNDGEMTRRIPVIVMTGRRIDGRHDMALEREMVSRRGAAAYVPKPLDMLALMQTIERLLDKSPNGQQPWSRRKAGVLRGA